MANLKRLRAARDFWLSVPPERVDLWDFSYRSLQQTGFDDFNRPTLHPSVTRLGKWYTCPYSRLAPA